MAIITGWTINEEELRVPLNKAAKPANSIQLRVRGGHQMKTFIAALLVVLAASAKSAPAEPFITSDALATSSICAINAVSPPLDHFKCYSVRGDSLNVGVNLLDQFGARGATVVRPVSICNPVDKDGLGIIDPDTHLVCYSIRPRRAAGHTVLVDNQLGEQILKVLDSETVCVPSFKTILLSGEPCGPAVCGPKEECCNPLLGICTRPGEVCVLE